MAKKQAKTKQVSIVNYYDVDANNGDVRDTAEFAEFEQKVESALKQNPQTIREIRLATKTDNYYWLSMALDNLVVKGRAKLIRGYLDKYVIGNGEVKVLRKVSKFDYSHNFLSV